MNALITDTCLRILRRLQPYWRARELRGKHGIIHRYQDKPDKTFSARLLADVMLGHLALGVFDDDGEAMKTATDILPEALDRQDPSGAFRWNLPDPFCTHPAGVRDQVDLAMVLDAAATFEAFAPVDDDTWSKIQRMSTRAACYLRTTLLPDRPGIVRKRHYEDFPPVADVLNGDALAAKAFFTAARLGAPPAHAEIDSFLRHLAARFGRHQAGWWVYNESLRDGSSIPSDVPGSSIFFQAMMIFHLLPIVREPRYRHYDALIGNALEAVAQCVGIDGRIDYTHENRSELVGKPNALIASCLAASGENEAASKALARLEFIQGHLIDAEGNVSDEEGNAVSDIWRVWLFSDVARCAFSLAEASRPKSAIPYENTEERSGYEAIH